MNIDKLAPELWRIQVGAAVRIIRFRPEEGTFTPWEVLTTDGRAVWAAPSFDSAARWVIRTIAGSAANQVIDL